MLLLIVFDVEAEYSCACIRHSVPMTIERAERSMSWRSSENSICHIVIG